MVGALTIGLVGILIELALMKLVAVPGDMLIKLGRNLDALFLCAAGSILNVAAQLYVVGAYAIGVVALLHYYIDLKPDIATWPLWIAAYIHSVLVSLYGLKDIYRDIQDRQYSRTIEDASLIVVALLAQVLFFMIVYSPAVLRPLYGWISHFGNLLK